MTYVLKYCPPLYWNSISGCLFVCLLVAKISVYRIDSTKQNAGKTFSLFFTARLWWFLDYIFPLSLLPSSPLLYWGATWLIYLQNDPLHMRVRPTKPMLFWFFLLPSDSLLGHTAIFTVYLVDYSFRQGPLSFSTATAPTTDYFYYKWVVISKFNPPIWRWDRWLWIV